MSNKIIIGFIVVLVIIAGVFLFTRKSKPTLLPKQDNAIATPGIINEISNENPVATSTITVTKDGFEPKIISIKPGIRVVWTNKSGKDAAVASDDHPTHLLYPELNLGQFGDGASVQLVLDKAGEYSYHNHYQPTQTGKIIVQ